MDFENIEIPVEIYRGRNFPRRDNNNNNNTLIVNVRLSFRRNIYTAHILLTQIVVYINCKYFLNKQKKKKKKHRNNRE